MLACAQKSFISRKMDSDNSFSFGYNTPHHFVISQWHFRHAIFLIWRGFWFIWHLAWLIHGIQEEIELSGCTLKWCIYLTNWSYTLLLLQSFTHFSVVVYHTYKGQTTKQHFKDGISWYHKLLWLLTSISFDAAIIVTVTFWTLEYKELEHIITFITHAFNTVYVVSDILVVASPVRFQHVLYSSIYAIMFGIFSIVFHLAGGTNSYAEPYIYSTLDWSKPGPTILIALCIAFPAMFLAHFLQFHLYKLRLHIWNSCGEKGHFKEDIVSVQGNKKIK